MNKEDKELLLKDLYGRSPYGVKCCVRNNHKLCGNLVGIVGENIYIFSSGCSTFNISVIKPYLFPLSSMTEEQFNELKSYANLKYEDNTLELVEWDNNYKTLEFWLEEIPSYCVIKVFDWLNKNHFDYRGLIEKGLAIDATNLNIY